MENIFKKKESLLAYTYSRRNMQPFTQKGQTPLFLKQKTFSIRLHFLNLHEMENIFKKKESLLA